MNSNSTDPAERLNQAWKIWRAPMPLPEISGFSSATDEEQTVRELLEIDVWHRGANSLPISSEVYSGIAPLTQYLDLIHDAINIEGDPAQRLLLGNKIGKYTLVEVLGRGQMGIVFKAQHEILPRFQAVKFINDEVIASLSAVEREDRTRTFIQEARTLSELSTSRSFPQIFDCGYINERPFIAMEVITGVTLQKQLEESGCLSWDQAIRVGIIVAQKLIPAHELNIVHCDIKPSNIMMIGSLSELVILDFGVSRIPRSERIERTSDINAPELTGQSIRAGSLGFGAPEQFLNNRSVTPAADQYAIAATIVYLATNKHVTSIDLENIQIPEPFRPALKKALSDAADRWEDCQVFSEELERAVVNATELRERELERRRRLNHTKQFWTSERKRGNAFGMYILFLGSASVLLTQRIKSSPELGFRDRWASPIDLGIGILLLTGYLGVVVSTTRNLISLWRFRREIVLSKPLLKALQVAIILFIGPYFCYMSWTLLRLDDEAEKSRAYYAQLNADHQEKRSNDFVNAGRTAAELALVIELSFQDDDPDNVYRQYPSPLRFESAIDVELVSREFLRRLDLQPFVSQSELLRSVLVRSEPHPGYAKDLEFTQKAITAMSRLDELRGVCRTLQFIRSEYRTSMGEMFDCDEVIRYLVDSRTSDADAYPTELDGNIHGACTIASGPAVEPGSRILQNLLELKGARPRNPNRRTRLLEERAMNVPSVFAAIAYSQSRSSVEGLHSGDRCAIRRSGLTAAQTRSFLTRISGHSWEQRLAIASTWLAEGDAVMAAMEIDGIIVEREKAFQKENEHASTGNRLSQQAFRTKGYGSERSGQDAFRNFDGSFSELERLPIDSVVEALKQAASLSSKPDIVKQGLLFALVSEADYRILEGRHQSAASVYYEAAFEYGRELQKHNDDTSRLLAVCCLHLAIHETTAVEQVKWLTEAKGLINSLQ